MDDGITLGQLWLPILLSAVVVFIVSALAWMVMPHHKDDFKPLPNEDGLMSAVRSQNLAPGIYAFPECRDKAKMKDPAFKAKLDAGPTGLLNVFPPGAYTNMGLKMGLSFGFYLVVGIFVAYVTSRCIPGAEASFAFVFQIAGTTAIMAYCFGSIPNAIWFSTPVRNIVTNLVDGLVYGLLTGLIFGMLWP